MITLLHLWFYHVNMERKHTYRVRRGVMHIKILVIVNEDLYFISNYKKADCQWMWETYMKRDAKIISNIFKRDL